MSVIKIISQYISGTIHQFDVDQNVAIALKKQLISLTDIDQRRGDYTQSFSLPRTANNETFFGSWGDPSTIGANWNARVEAPAWLLEDDNIIIEGILRLESTNPQMDRYYISITGAVMTIKSLLGESTVSQLDMTSWIYTASQIFSTWNRSIFSGDMVFPIHDFGFGWGLYKKSTTANVVQDMKAASTPIILNQTIPCFRMTKILKAIIEDKGIDLDGSFFSETSVDEIYIQADTPLTSFGTGVGLFTTKIGSTTSLDATRRTMMWVGNPIMGDFSDSTYTYTAPLAGTYTFQVSFTPNSGTPTSMNCALYYYKNGSTTVATANFDWSGSLLDNRSFVLAAGDTLRLEWQAVGGTVTYAGNITTGGADYWKLTNVVTTGVSIDPSAYWGQHRQIDLFTSIVKIFNLIPWFTEEKVLRLDTWAYYMANYGSKKDWSDKVDIPSIKVRPINGELRNPVNLSLQEADVIINRQYQDAVGRPYGSYREDQNIPGTLPEQRPFEMFSPAAPQEIISDAAGVSYADVLICKYYTDEDSLAYKSPGLQLMYYCGARSIATSIYTTDSAGGATTARSVYPYFSNFLLNSASSYAVASTTLDLNFAWWTPPSPSMTITSISEQGLFNRYFREMIRERYDEGSKILEMNVLLDPADIANFNFADTIIVTVNGTPVGLRIVEINDYSPNSRRLTKVKAYITFIA